MSTRSELEIKNVTLVTETTLEGIVRKIGMASAYDLRNAPDGKNYGIHGAELWFSIQRGQCGIMLNWMTPFYLPHVRKEQEQNGGSKYEFDGLGNIGYHSPIPLYEGQTEATKKCGFTGGCCFVDGTGVGATELFDKAVIDPAAIWSDLEERLKKLEEGIGKEKEEMARAG